MVESADNLGLMGALGWEIAARCFDSQLGRNPEIETQFGIASERDSGISMDTFRLSTSNPRE